MKGLTIFIKKTASYIIRGGFYNLFKKLRISRSTFSIIYLSTQSNLAGQQKK
jgi:hypothetical protein